MDVRMFITSAGIFLAKVKQETEKFYVLEDPRIIGSDVNNPNQLNFLPFPPFAALKQNFRIYRSQLIFEAYEVENDLENKYIESVSNITLINK